jgi:hypothetical protein
VDSSNDIHERMHHQLQEVLRSSFSQVEAWHPYELAALQILIFAEGANPIQLRMPLPYPAESKIGTSYQVKIYQSMNASARPENFE